ncbi:2-hydroxyacid dehydrogenase [Aliihoeflea sp. PC F10.4]
MKGSSRGGIVQLASISPEFDAQLAREFPVVQLFTEAKRDHCEMWHLRESRLAVTTVRRGLSASDLSALPGLQAVCSWGVGYDTLDIAAARAAGVRISNTPDVLDECVGDLAWALMLATARRVAMADKYVKDGRWKQLGEFPLAIRVSGKRLGILGLGRIGKAIAKRGSGFSMDIRYHSRRALPDVGYALESDLVALARWADFLVIAVPANAQTRNLVDREVIDALGPSGILVNIARGSVVDQAALEHALVHGKLAGAGLDVLDREPFPHHPFPTVTDRVVLTPHIGSATIDTRLAMEQLVLDNARDFFEFGRLRTEV